MRRSSHGPVASRKLSQPPGRYWRAMPSTPAGVRQRLPNGGSATPDGNIVKRRRRVRIRPSRARRRALGVMPSKRSTWRDRGYEPGNVRLAAARPTFNIRLDTARVQRHETPKGQCSRRARLVAHAAPTRDLSALKAAKKIPFSQPVWTAVASSAQETQTGASARCTYKASCQLAPRQTLLDLVHFAIQDKFSVAIMSSQSLMKLDGGSRVPLFRSSRRRAVAR
jgi:hypothetical protein